MQVKLCIRTRSIREIGSKLIIRAHRIACEDIGVTTLGELIDIEEEFPALYSCRAVLPPAIKVLLSHTVVGGILLALLRTGIVVIAPT